MKKYLILLFLLFPAFTWAGVGSGLSTRQNLDQTLKTGNTTDQDIISQGVGIFIGGVAAGNLVIGPGYPIAGCNMTPLGNVLCIGNLTMDGNGLFGGGIHATSSIVSKTGDIAVAAGNYLYFDYPANTIGFRNSGTNTIRTLNKVLIDPPSVVMPLFVRTGGNGPMVFLEHFGITGDTLSVENHNILNGHAGYFLTSDGSTSSTLAVESHGGGPVDYSIEVIDSDAAISGVFSRVNNTGDLYGGNQTGSGNLIQLDTNAVEKFKVDNSGNIYASGSVSATTYYGDGSNLTNLPFQDQLASGSHYFKYDPDLFGLGFTAWRSNAEFIFVQNATNPMAMITSADLGGGPQAAFLIQPDGGSDAVVFLSYDYNTAKASFILGAPGVDSKILLVDRFADKTFEVDKFGNVFATGDMVVSSSYFGDGSNLTGIDVGDIDITLGLGDTATGKSLNLQTASGNDGFIFDPISDSVVNLTVGSIADDVKGAFRVNNATDTIFYADGPNTRVDIGTSGQYVDVRVWGDINASGTVIFDDTIEKRRMIQISGSPGQANVPGNADTCGPGTKDFGIGDYLYYSFTNPEDYESASMTVEVIFQQDDVDATSKEYRYEINYWCYAPGDVIGTDSEDGTIQMPDTVQPNTQCDTQLYRFDIPWADAGHNEYCSFQLERIALVAGVDADMDVLHIDQHYIAYKVAQ